MNKEDNIQMVTDNALCTACGACCGICPINAIYMTYNTAGYLMACVDESKCTHCGVCYSICPSVPDNIPAQEHVDIFHGKYIAGYIGHARDEKTRQGSQSGGIVTALLCYLLENKKIDGAIVNKFGKRTRKPQSVCAETVEETRKCAGSFYSQSSVVKTVLENNKKKTAAVVLGCQAESLALIRKKYPQIRLPKYIIGLFCAGQYSGNYIDDLIHSSECNPLEVTNFRFRDKNAGGWPGNVKIYTADKEYVLDKSKRFFLKSVYESFRCLLCFDQLNIYSDISVGDPWGIQREDEKAGNSVIIVRTKKGQELLEEASNLGVIAIEPLPVEKIIRGQTVDNRLKTQFFTAMKICKNMGFKLPFNEEKFKHISYNLPTAKKSREIAKRLLFSRKVFLEEDLRKLQELISDRKSELQKKAFLSKLNFPRRAFAYCLRRFRTLRSSP